MAKRQVKWLAHKISEGVKGWCINEGEWEKGRTLSGQRRERRKEIIVFSGPKILWGIWGLVYLRNGGALEVI